MTCATMSLADGQIRLDAASRTSRALLPLALCNQLAARWQGSVGAWASPHEESAKEHRQLPDREQLEFDIVLVDCPS